MTLSLGGSYIALWIVVVLQGVLILALLRQIEGARRLFERRGFSLSDRLPAGSLAPDVSGLDLRSQRHTRSPGSDGKGTLILFLTPECSFCRDLVAGLEWAIANSPVDVLVVCQGTLQNCLRLLSERSAIIVFVDAEVAAKAYRVAGFPTVVFVDENRRIQSYHYPRDAHELKGLVVREEGGRDLAVGRKTAPALRSTES